jgi:NAD(P)H-hydrate epimerase
MKIFPGEEIKKADAYTIANEPIQSIDLMERAAKKLTKWISKRVDNTHVIRIFAGSGNNGGDGLALARLLAKKKYLVEVYIIKGEGKYSPDCETNLNRLQEIETLRINFLKEAKDFLLIDEDDIVVDALFGSGLSRPVSGFVAEIIDFINKSSAIKVAIDVPSGLFIDRHSNEKEGAIVRADYTLSFQMPKLAFMHPENDKFVGRWKIVDIGLSADFINQAATKYFFIEKKDARLLIKARPKFSHKGFFGHAMMVAGGEGKFGAAVLSAKACLRSGVGLLHVHIPKSGSSILQTATPETMLSIDKNESYFSEVPDLSAYSAIGVGPGIGMEKQSQNALKMLIQNYQKPMVFDADTLNILSENKTWLSFLPKGSILTPHPKEFERLAGKWKNDFEKIEMQREFAFKFGVYVVLKGAHTSTCFPDGDVYFNSTGNPGMATGGSGDVLTGIITGLLAQGFTPGAASVLGVYLHGLAGDLAAKKRGLEAMLAGDIIEKLGKAFLELTK